MLVQLKLRFCARLVIVSNLDHTSSRQAREGRTSRMAGTAWTSWAKSRGGVQWSASGMWGALLWASGLQSGTCCDTHVYPWLRGSYRGYWRDRQALSGGQGQYAGRGQYGGINKTCGNPKTPLWYMLATYAWVQPTYLCFFFSIWKWLWNFYNAGYFFFFLLHYLETILIIWRQRGKNTGMGIRVTTMTVQSWQELGVVGVFLCTDVWARGVWGKLSEPLHCISHVKFWNLHSPLKIISRVRRKTVLDDLNRWRKRKKQVKYV